MPDDREKDPKLFVSDILDEGQGSEGVRGDILNIIGADVDLDDSVSAPQKYLRDISFGLLQRLEEMGVEEASLIRDKLEEIGESAGDPLAVDLSIVVVVLDEERQATKDPDEQSRLRRLARTADTAFALATAMGVSVLEGGDKQARRLLQDSSEALAESELGEEEARSFEELIAETKSTLPDAK